MELVISLLPIMVALIAIMISKKAILSLTIAVLFGALLAFNFNAIDALIFLFAEFVAITSDLSHYMAIIIFLALIGAITAMLSSIGATSSFAKWASTKAKNKISAQLVAWFLGLAIFIDDYFNVLVVGEVAGPISDEQNVSRAKLAYIVDSTAAPVAVMVPISTWGAFVLGIIATAIVSNQDMSAMQIFLGSLKFQFYSIGAIMLVLMTIIFRLNVGKMADFEDAAENNNDISKLDQGEINNICTLTKAKVWVLPLTIGSLVVATILSWLTLAGWDAKNLLHTGITIPLVLGSLVALLVVTIASIKRKQSTENMIKSAGIGVKSMYHAMAILMLAWIFGAVVLEIGTGELLADAVVKSQFEASALPVVIFVIAALMAFSTGSSWGTFAVLLPFAITLGINKDPQILYAIVGAVLGGGVLGDHCSPVSDTTVLSATGSRCKHNAHFRSQLPYAVSIGLNTLLAYIVFGMTTSLLITWATMIIGFTLTVLIFMKLSKAQRFKIT